MMKGISQCCRFCEERYPACHDTCERYLSAAAEWEKYKAQVKAEKDDEFYIYKVTRIKAETKRRSKYGK